MPMAISYFSYMQIPVFPATLFAPSNMHLHHQMSLAEPSVSASTVIAGLIDSSPSSPTCAHEHVPSLPETRHISSAPPASKTLEVTLISLSWKTWKSFCSYENLAKSSSCHSMSPRRHADMRRSVYYVACFLCGTCAHSTNLASRPYSCSGRI